MEINYGEIAAVFTAVCWSFTSMFFTISGSIIGSVNVNRLRLSIAFIFLLAVHYITTGQPFPTGAPLEKWFWLGLSGIVGFSIGDAMLFEAFVLVGARVSMLLMSLVPILSALFAWLFLEEYLSLIEVLAICITVGGIIWVVIDKNRNSDLKPGNKFILGIGLGIGGALGQTFGLILSKKGLEGNFTALSGNLIRVLVALAILWTVTILRGKVKQTFRSLKNKKAALTLLGGSFFGPFLGVWLSLIAVKYARIGIASTLMSTTPIMLIPISYWIFKEKISGRAVFGTLIAVLGVALLLLNGQG